jgi:hypothetical protein
MRTLFSPTATTVAGPTYALDICMGRIYTRFANCASRASGRGNAVCPVIANGTDDQ